MRPSFCRCRLSRDGVETRLNTTVVGARMEDGDKLIDAVNDDLKYSIAVDEILLSIGRVPNVEESGPRGRRHRLRAGAGH